MPSDSDVDLTCAKSKSIVRAQTRSTTSEKKTEPKADIGPNALDQAQLRQLFRTPTCLDAGHVIRPSRWCLETTKNCVNYQNCGRNSGSSIHSGARRVGAARGSSDSTPTRNLGVDLIFHSIGSPLTNAGSLLGNIGGFHLVMESISVSCSVAGVRLQSCSPQDASQLAPTCSHTSTMKVSALSVLRPSAARYRTDTRRQLPSCIADSQPCPLPTPLVPAGTLR